MAITTMITTIVVAAIVASVLRTWMHARVALRSSAAAADVAGRPSLLDVVLSGIVAVRAELARRSVVAPMVAPTVPAQVAPGTTLAASVVDVPAPLADAPAVDATAAANLAAASAFERVPLTTTAG